MTAIIYIFCIAFFLLAGFLFAGSEMALISINKYRVQKKSEAGDIRSQSLYEIIKDPIRMINTLLIGINLSIVAGSIFIHALLKEFHVKNHTLWALLASSFIYLLIAELIPKTLFHIAPNKMALKILPFLKVSFSSFRHIEKYFSALVNKTIKKNPDIHKKKLSRDEFLDLLNLASSEGSVYDEEKSLILKAFNLSLSKITDIMIPMERVDGIREDSDISQAVLKSKESRHSRIVVTSREDNTRIIGIITIYDILFSTESIKDIPSIMRPPVFVKDMITCDKALRKLRSHKTPFLVVKDTGSNDKSIGIITASDLINHLFGEKLF